MGTSQQAEILAVKIGLLPLHDRHELNVLVVTDSQYVQGIFSDADWQLKFNRTMIHTTRKLIRQLNSFRIQWVKGHAETDDNIRADFLAAIACGRKTCPDIMPSQLEEFGFPTMGDCQNEMTETCTLLPEQLSK